MSPIKRFAINSFIALPVIAAFFMAHSLVREIDKTPECNSNLDAMVLQCLPDALNERTTFNLVQVDNKMKLVCEKHRTRNYSQPVKQPSVRFVLALRADQ